MSIQPSSTARLSLGKGASAKPKAPKLGDLSDLGDDLHLEKSWGEQGMAEDDVDGGHGAGGRRGGEVAYPVPQMEDDGQAGDEGGGGGGRGPQQQHLYGGGGAAYGGAMQQQQQQQRPLGPGPGGMGSGFSGARPAAFGAAPINHAPKVYNPATGAMEPAPVSTHSISKRAMNFDAEAPRDSGAGARRSDGGGAPSGWPAGAPPGSKCGYHYTAEGYAYLVEFLAPAFQALIA